MSGPQRVSLLTPDGVRLSALHWAAGGRTVYLTSNLKRTDAHRFYARLGFEQSHAGFKLKL